MTFYYTADLRGGGGGGGLCTWVIFEGLYGAFAVRGLYMYIIFMSRNMSYLVSLANAVDPMPNTNRPDNTPPFRQD